jgi:hypothetical protein
MSKNVLLQIAETITCDIDDFCVQFFQEEPRTHLGGSIIGRKCSRRIWYDFRHAMPNNVIGNNSKSAGQIYRIFNRGHREESFFLQMLAGVGCVFMEPPADQKQFRIVDVNGHFGGSIDAVGYLPKKFDMLSPIGFEFKTANMSEFNRVKKDGVKLYKPEHHSQMCVYGYKFGLTHFLYCVVDKNTDEYHIELIEVDVELGREMIDKANIVVNSPIPLPRIAMTSTNWSCKVCPYTDICFNKQRAAINCRTCQHSKPVEGGKWVCQLAGGIEPPADVQKSGCSQYQPINMDL